MVWCGLAAGSVLAEEARVLQDEAGRISFQLNAVNWRNTGLTATAEAQRYPEAIGRLITEKLEFVAVEKEVVKSRLIGFWTWEEQSKVKTVVTRDGTVIVLRPATGAEATVGIERFDNPFVLLVGSALALLAAGNLMAKRRPRVAFPTVAAIVAAVVAATIAENEESGWRWYRRFSALAGILLILSVVVVSVRMPTTVNASPAFANRQLRGFFEYAR